VLILLASAVFVVVLFRWLHCLRCSDISCRVAVAPSRWRGFPTPTKDGILRNSACVLMFSIGWSSACRSFSAAPRRVRLGFAQSCSPSALLAAASLAGPLQAALAVGARSPCPRRQCPAHSTERIQLETPTGATSSACCFSRTSGRPAADLIPGWRGAAASLPSVLAFALAKATVVLVVLLFVGQRLMRAGFTSWRAPLARAFHSQRLADYAGACLDHGSAGLSLALGAFLAGMLIAETEYRHQVEEDIRPFGSPAGSVLRDHGMRLDLGTVAANFSLTLALSAALVVFKFILVAARACSGPVRRGRAHRARSRQVGEFGLVLMVLAQSVALLDRDFSQLVSRDAALHARRSVPHSGKRQARAALSSAEWMLQSLALHRVAAQSLATERHVVGAVRPNGPAPAHMLEQERIVVIASTPIRSACAERRSGREGRFRRRVAARNALAAGVARASALVITFADTQLALRILHHVRALNPALPVISALWTTRT